MKNILKCVVLLVFCVLAISCSRREVILRISVSHMPMTFDYVLMNDTVSIFVNNNIFETFLRRIDGRDVPVVANTWYLKNDSTFVVQFKSNLRFSDGEFVTDDDIIYSLNRTKNTETWRDSVINSFEINEGNLLYIHFSGSPAPITLFLSQVVIYKAEYLKKGDDIFLRDNPMSTGEYYLYYKSAEKMVLKKNRFNRNYRINRLSPDVVELINVPSIYTRVEMLLNNEVDFIRHLPFSAYADLLNNDRFVTFYQAGNSYTFMMLDATRTQSPGINLRVNPLRDGRVRHAIAHALDMQSFIDDRLMGHGNTLAIPAMRYLIGYPDHLEYYKFDIAHSKSLMSQAGFSDGFDIQICVVSGYLNNYLAEFIKESLKQININVEINFHNANVFRTAINANPPSAYISTAVWPDGVENVLPALANKFFIGDSILGANVMNNYAPHIQELIITIFGLSSLDHRLTEMYVRLADYVYDEAMVIPLFQPYNLSAVNNSFSYEHSSIVLFSNFKIRR